ncbi:MAG: hypothetical protein ABIG03_07390 [Candidatus Eisenbacteria bacterium]
MGARLLTASVAAVVLTIPTSGAALAQDEKPAAGQSAYDVPVPAWVADAATGLKREFVMGVARQAVSLAEARATEEVRLLVDAADDMSAAAGRVRNTMNTIGSIDSSFGVPGISRLVTAEGAVRDTLFGFVVWHESAAGESPEIAATLESAVGLMLSLSEAAKTNAGRLAGNADDVREALAAEDYASIASSSGVVTEATGQLELVAGKAEEVSASIEEIVWKIQDGSGSLLESEWEQVLLAVSETRRLASKIRPALQSLRDGSGASEALSASLQGMVESIAIMEGASADDAGYVRYPASLFEKDVAVVTALEGNVTGENAAQFPGESASAVAWLLTKIVAADRALAERAVEYTSTEVGRAMDRLEDRHKDSSGFDESASGRDREQAFEPVDRALRANRQLESARASARAARASHAKGVAREADGAGSLGVALSHYRDAWAHSISAGEAAGKA